MDNKLKEITMATDKVRTSFFPDNGIHGGYLTIHDGRKKVKLFPEDIFALLKTLKDADVIRLVMLSKKWDKKIGNIG